MLTPEDQPRDFQYSDGDAAEEAVLDAVSAAEDVSAGSDELARHITDWPTRYHLSPVRGDLLEPFRWDSLEVLEIGAGCGALTRVLGEAGARVSAVEGSLRRATITSRRCRGLENVEVFCDDFAAFPATRAYDAVVAVGVLEYAPRFFATSDPIAAFLQKVRGLLKPDGVLLLAIENRLGLKYFAGAREDHVGELFYGIEDRYAPDDGVVTLGRLELLRRLESCDMPVREVILPFPDYKHPKVMLRSAALDSSILDVGELLAHAGRGVDEPSAPLLFAEEAAWSSLSANGLVDDLSNSFLVIAGSQDGARSLLADPWLAKTYASGRRRPFRTVTTFRDAGDRVIVEKRLRHPAVCPPADAKASLDIQPVSDYVVGDSLARHCFRVAGRQQASVSDIVEAVRPWLALLAESADPSDGRMPGRYIDCVPGNLLLSGSAPHGVEYFDQEWVYREGVRPERVIFRGMLLLVARLEAAAVAPALRDAPIRVLVAAVLEAFGASTSTSLQDELLEEEADWVSQVMPLSRTAYLETIRAALDAPLGASCRLGAFADAPVLVARVLAGRAREIAALQAAIAEKDHHIAKLEAEAHGIIALKDEALVAKDREIASITARDEAQVAALRQVETSISWRLTAPLRSVARKARRE